MHTANKINLSACNCYITCMIDCLSQCLGIKVCTIEIARGCALLNVHCIADFDCVFIELQKKPQCTC